MKIHTFRSFEDNIDHSNPHVKEYSVKFSEIVDAPPLRFVLVSRLLFTDFKHTYQLELRLFQ